jgi:Fe-S-cluster-containing hydrogenase component 2
VIKVTTGTLNQLVVDLDKCIGCWACAHVCPAGLITFVDEDQQRTLHFAYICRQDCTRCADACPEDAIALTPAKEVVPESTYLTATFSLLACQGCGKPFTTARIVDKLLGVIPPEFQTDSQDSSWIQLCPSCRRLTEGKRVAKEWVMSRWPRDG